MELTLLVPMSFHIPMGVDIFRVVGRITGDFDLLETPLWKIHIASTEIAAEDSVSQSEASGQGPDLASVT